MRNVEFRAVGDPVLFVSNPKGMDQAMRRDLLDGVNQLNRLQYESVGDPEIATRIEAYELAYRMQTSVPELMDIAKEPKALREAYGSGGHDRDLVREAYMRLQVRAAQREFGDAVAVVCGAWHVPALRQKTPPHPGRVPTLYTCVPAGTSRSGRQFPRRHVRAASTPRSTRPPISSSSERGTPAM